MKKYNNIIFDLDGTLIDSSVGIIQSIMHALEKFDIEVDNKNELLEFIGPPLMDSFQKYYGFSEEEAECAIKHYREYFKDKGIFENSLYDGVEGLLKVLKDRDKKLLIATTKPEVYAIEVIKYYNLDNLFEFIAGSHLDGRRVDKEELIRYALESSSLESLNETVMIGDRKYDILGARKVGIDSIGVLYGFGDRKELEDAGANHIVSSPVDALKILTCND